MKTNVQLKGLLMLCVVIGIIIVYVNFQHSKIGTVLLIASVVLSFIAAYYIGDNTNDKQFERIMKKVGGDNLFYIVDGSAAVEVESLNIYYRLKRNKYDKILELSNNVEISVSCALPICTSTKEAFNNIKNDLTASLIEDIAKCVKFKYKHYFFSVDIELQPAKFSVPAIRQIQQSLVSVLINKYHLNTIKQYFKVNEDNNRIFYWEFIGNNAVRCVSYNAENDVWDCDNEDVSCDLSDDIGKATIITEKEFETVYEQVENMKTAE